MSESHASELEVDSTESFFTFLGPTVRKLLDRVSGRAVGLDTEGGRSTERVRVRATGTRDTSVVSERRFGPESLCVLAILGLRLKKQYNWKKIYYI